MVRHGDDNKRTLEAEMTSPKTEAGANDNRKAEELDRCYGRIGISAVAAALTFKHSPPDFPCAGRPSGGMSVPPAAAPAVATG
jgi:hypothetical protein